ncbi:MAG: Fic/DOC family protein [Sulfurimonas sp.]|uniref:Fic/DOC family protein n=1 Tax=Sulfurimonas sp. TaxID=2022749 RepID=UPI003D09C1E2
MASKYKNQVSSIYIKDSDVPINKAGIKSSEQIHELEKELLFEAYEIFYDELNEDTVFDENYFIQLHKRTFGNLYEWAGKYRDFNMSKDESKFCQGMYVNSSSKKIFDELKKDNYLKDYEHKSKEDFAQKLAYYKSELIALHPFYELNGRITRLFFDMIAVYNGYKYIDYSSVSTKEYIDAAIECVIYANSEKMQDIIFNGLKR